MCGSDFGYMSAGGFSDFLKIGRYDDPEGWKIVWDVENHPDIGRWADETGWERSAVRKHIEGHRERMRRLRHLYCACTPINLEARQPEIEIRTIHGRKGDPILAILRHDKERPNNSLLAVFNFSIQGRATFAFTPPAELPGEWVWQGQYGGGHLQEAERVKLGQDKFCRDNPMIELDPNSMVIYQHSTIKNPAGSSTWLD